MDSDDSDPMKETEDRMLEFEKNINMPSVKTFNFDKNDFKLSHLRYYMKNRSEFPPEVRMLEVMTISSFVVGLIGGAKRGLEVGHAVAKEGFKRSKIASRHQPELLKQIMMREGAKYALNGALRVPLFFGLLFGADVVACQYSLLRGWKAPILGYFAFFLDNLFHSKKKKSLSISLSLSVLRWVLFLCMLAKDQECLYLLCCLLPLWVWYLVC